MSGHGGDGGRHKRDVMGRGFQWDNIEVKVGLEAVRIEGNDLLDGEENRDEVLEEVSETVILFTSFLLTSFLLSWVIL